MKNLQLEWDDLPITNQIKTSICFPNTFFSAHQRAWVGVSIASSAYGGVATGPTVGAFGVRARACIYNHLMDDLPIIAGYNDDYFYIMTFDIYIYLFIY